MRPRIAISPGLATRLRRHARQTAVQSRRRLSDDLRQHALAELTRSTPVRTGRLRRSWSDAAGGGGDDALVDETDAVGVSERTATSTVPYVGYVEYGTSRQRPQRLAAAALRVARSVAAALFRLRD